MTAVHLKHVGGTLHIVSVEPSEPHLPGSMGFGSYDRAVGGAVEMALQLGLPVDDETDRLTAYDFEQLKAATAAERK